VVMAAAIEQLLPLSGDEAAFMAALSDVPISNWNGIEVGRLRASATLRGTLPPARP